MAAHTVGPWEINGEGAIVAVVAPARYGLAGVITAPLTSRLEPVAEEQQHANAALLVAAPDLLAASLALLEHMRPLVLMLPADNPVAVAFGQLDAAAQRATTTEDVCSTQS